MENMITLTIDGIEVQAPQGSTVLEAARLAGIRIPTLCYLKGVNEIGACRMCVVDSGARSLQAACVLPASQGMNVKTNTPQIRDYRRNILELLLSTMPFRGVPAEEPAEPKGAEAPAFAAEVWQCSVCGYIHEGPLPADFRCPVCRQGASGFVRVEA